MVELLLKSDDVPVVTRPSRRHWLRWVLGLSLLGLLVFSGIGLGLPRYRALQWVRFASRHDGEVKLGSTCPEWILKLATKHGFAKRLDFLITRVEHLKIPKAPLDRTWLSRLQGLSHLQTLAIPDAQIGDTELRCLSGLTQLRELNLAGTHITDAGFTHFTRLRNLRYLDVSRTAVTGKGLTFLPVSLRGLDCNASAFDDEGAANLGQFRQLGRLGLEGTRVTDAGLAPLAACNRLVTLDLSHTCVTGSGLSALAGHPHLSMLYLADTPLEGRHLVMLATLPDLFWLDLSGTPLDDAALAYLFPLRRLNFLSLARTNVTPDGFTDLTFLHSVGRLSLAYTQVDDRLVPTFRELPELSSIDVQGTKVTSEGLAQLAKRWITHSRTRVSFCH